MSSCSVLINQTLHPDSTTGSVAGTDISLAAETKHRLSCYRSGWTCPMRNGHASYILTAACAAATVIASSGPVSLLTRRDVIDVCTASAAVLMSVISTMLLGFRIRRARTFTAIDWVGGAVRVMGSGCLRSIMFLLSMYVGLGIVILNPIAGWLSQFLEGGLMAGLFSALSAWLSVWSVSRLVAPSPESGDSRMLQHARWFCADELPQNSRFSPFSAATR